MRSRRINSWLFTVCLLGVVISNAGYAKNYLIKTHLYPNGLIMNARLITAPDCTSFFHLEDNHAELNLLLPPAGGSNIEIGQAVHHHLLSPEVLTFNQVTHGLALQPRTLPGGMTYSCNLPGGSYLLSELLLSGNQDNLAIRGVAVRLLIPEFFTEPVHLIQSLTTAEGMQIIQAAVNPGPNQQNISITWAIDSSNTLTMNLFSGVVGFAEADQPLAVATVSEEVFELNPPSEKDKSRKRKKKDGDAGDKYLKYTVDGLSAPNGASVSGTDRGFYDSSIPRTMLPLGIKADPIKLSAITLVVWAVVRAGFSVF